MHILKIHFHSQLMLKFLFSEYNCDYEYGFGQGGFDYYRGEFSDRLKCSEECSRMKKSGFSVNGASYSTDSKICYCKANMKRIEGAKKWLSCFLQQKKQNGKNKPTTKIRTLLKKTTTTSTKSPTTTTTTTTITAPTTTPTTTSTSTISKTTTLPTARITTTAQTTTSTTTSTTTPPPTTKTTEPTTTPTTISTPLNTTTSIVRTTTTAPTTTPPPPTKKTEPTTAPTTTSTPLKTTTSPTARTTTTAPTTTSTTTELTKTPKTTKSTTSEEDIRFPEKTTLTTTEPFIEVGPEIISTTIITETNTPTDHTTTATKSTTIELPITRSDKSETPTIITPTTGLNFETTEESQKEWDNIANEINITTLSTSKSLASESTLTTKSILRNLNEITIAKNISKISAEISGNDNFPISSTPIITDSYKIVSLYNTLPTTSTVKVKSNTDLSVLNAISTRTLSATSSVFESRSILTDYKDYQKQITATKSTSEALATTMSKLDDIRMPVTESLFPSKIPAETMSISERLTTISKENTNVNLPKFTTVLNSTAQTMYESMPVQRQLLSMTPSEVILPLSKSTITPQLSKVRPISSKSVDEQHGVSTQKSYIEEVTRSSVLEIKFPKKVSKLIPSMLSTGITSTPSSRILSSNTILIATPADHTMKTFPLVLTQKIKSERYILPYTSEWKKMPKETLSVMASSSINLSQQENSPEVIGSRFNATTKTTTLNNETISGELPIEVVAGIVKGEYVASESTSINELSKTITDSPTTEPLTDTLGEIGTNTPYPDNSTDIFTETPPDRTTESSGIDLQEIIDLFGGPQVPLNETHDNSISTSIHVTGNDEFHPLKDLFCLPDEMLVLLDNTYLVEDSLVFLNDTTCLSGPVNIKEGLTRVHIKYNTCGTSQQQSEDHIIYKNRIFYRDKSSNLYYAIFVECKLKSTSDLSIKTSFKFMEEPPVKVKASKFHSLFL